MSDPLEFSLKIFKKDLADISSLITRGENICLTSAPKMGDNRLIELLASTMGNHKPFEVVYDPANDLNFDQLRRSIKNGNKKILLFVPWLYDPIPGFYEEIERLFLTSSQKLQSVIRLNYDFLDDPVRYFPKSVKPLSTIYFRQPSNLQETRLIIEEYRTILGWDVSVKFERDIFQWSGGIPGLVKRISSFINTYGYFDIDEIISYPPTRIVLEDFKSMFNLLDEKHIISMGLISSEGKIHSKLLEVFLSERKAENTLDNAPILKELFIIFNENLGKLVTMEDISDKLGISEDFSLWGTYKQIERLRSKLPREFQIKNVRGKGYIMRKRNAR